MTVIVGAITGKEGDQCVTLAADSEIQYGWLKERSANPKIWVADDLFVVGGAGSIRGIQLARYELEWPIVSEDIDPEEWGVRYLVPSLLAVGETGQHLHHKNGTSHLDYDLLVGWGDRLIVIDSSGCVICPPEGRTAIGSGYAEALGYLGDEGPWTVDAVIEAARRAAISAVGVAGPIYYVSTDDLEVHCAD